MSKEKEQATQNALVQTFMVGNSEVKLSPTIIKNFLLKNQNVEVTMGEFKLFVELCKVNQLNPFLNEAYFIKYGTQPAQLVVGKDAILKRAVSHKAYRGMNSGIIVRDSKGEIVEREGLFYLPEEEVVGGWARVLKENVEPKYVSVAFHEVAQKTGQGVLNTNWRDRPATMVEKVAKVRALREQFVHELGGLIDIDETPRLDDDTILTGKRQVEEVEIVEQHDFNTPNENTGEIIEDNNTLNIEEL